MYGHAKINYHCTVALMFGVMNHIVAQQQRRDSSHIRPHEDLLSNYPPPPQLLVIIVVQYSRIETVPFQTGGGVQCMVYMLLHIKKNAS